MTDLTAPLHPGELPKAMRRGIEHIVERIVTASAVKGGGQDLLMRVYMAGVYHGAELAGQGIERRCSLTQGETP